MMFFRLTLLSVCLLPLVLAGCGRRVDVEIMRAFEQAQTTFDEADSPEDYLKAAALYQEILDSGIVSGAVLYNQGNAFMKAGRRGRAVAAYRRAMRYRPRDPYLEANLAYALGGDRPAGRQRPVIEYVLFWQDWLSYPEKFYAAGAAAVLAFALASVALYLPGRVIHGLTVAAVALTLLLALSAGYDWYRFDYVVHGVLVDDDVIARKGNAESYEPAFTEPLAEGTEFRLVDRRGGWFLVRVRGGQEGWVEEEAAVLY